jgi:hypothetical protein
MDLNYLFHRQQVERSRAEAAASEEARQAHLILASEYEREIERLSGGRIAFAEQSDEFAAGPLSAG